MRVLGSEPHLFGLRPSGHVLQAASLAPGVGRFASGPLLSPGCLLAPCSRASGVPCAGCSGQGLRSSAGGGGGHSALPTPCFPRRVAQPRPPVPRPKTPQGPEAIPSMASPLAAAPFPAGE